MSCEITATGVKALVEKLFDTGHQVMDYLVLSQRFRNCCDRKSRAAYAQSFALWQQATIEITCHDHCIIAFSLHVHILLFFTHIPFVVNHTINATPPERLQQNHGLASCFIPRGYLSQDDLKTRVYFHCCRFSTKSITCGYVTSTGMQGLAEELNETKISY